MKRLRILGIAVLAVAALSFADRPALAAAHADSQPWRGVRVKAKEALRVETLGLGRATYYVASPAGAVEAEVTGPGRLRILLRPEFPNTGSAAEEVGVTISISGAASREVAAFSMPSKASHYVGKSSAAVPGEVVTAYLDIPEGKRSIQIGAKRRVGVKLYVAR